MALWNRKSDPGSIGSEQPRVADSVTPREAAGGEAQRELSPELQLKAGQASRRLSAAFGQIVTVLMRSPAYKHFMLSDLEWFVAPALISGQFAVAEARSKSHGLITPVGVVLWARVSAEIDERLAASSEQPIRLKPQEWTSGDILWIVDAIGDRRILNVMLRRLAENDWKGRQVKLKARGKDGRIGVGELTVKQSPAAS